MNPPALLSLVELGGYPDFTVRYREAGFEVLSANSLRKAISLLKRRTPAVVVAEFNFQSDFRDRTSNLESLLATTQTRCPEARVIVFYEAQQVAHLQRFLDRFQVFDTIRFPIDEDRLMATLSRALAEGPGL